MIWAWDIECQGWDRYAVSCAAADDGQELALDTLDDVQAWYARTEPGDIILTHNGGRYDMLCMIDACPAIGSWRGTLAGSGLVSLRAKGHAELRDTFRVFPVSLEAWTGKKDVFPLVCECPRKCKGYCGIRATGERHPGERALLVDYCMQDCRALLEAYPRDIQRLEDLGLSARNARGEIRRTIGAIGWHTAADMAGLDKSPLEWPEYDHGIAAYYGGRAAVGLTACDEVHSDDVNSMYPWALTLPVPMGTPKISFGATARRRLRDGRPGAYEATVRLPESRWPALPHRGPDKSPSDPDDRGSMLWAWGEVHGTWTHVELEAAMERGAEIVELHSAYTYPSEDAVYQPYVEHVYAARQQAKAEGDDGWAKVLKFVLNAPTGKLAQRPGQATLVVRPDNVPVPADEQQTAAGRAKKTGPTYLGGLAWAILARKVPQSARPIHAAVLTSRARAQKLLPRLELADRLGAAVYCDTDSVKCTVELPHDGDELGGWGYEGVARDWRCVGPKLYRYWTADGEPVAKAKGVPEVTIEDVDAFRSYLRAVEDGWSPDELAAHYGDAVVRKEAGVEGVRSSYKKKGRAFSRREIKRTPRQDPHVAGTRWILPDGTTIPLERRDGVYYWGEVRADAYLPRVKVTHARKAAE